MEKGVFPDSTGKAFPKTSTFQNLEQPYFFCHHSCSLSQLQLCYLNCFSLLPINVKIMTLSFITCTDFWVLNGGESQKHFPALICICCYPRCPNSSYSFVKKYLSTTGTTCKRHLYLDHLLVLLFQMHTHSFDIWQNIVLVVKEKLPPQMGRRR